MIGERNSGLRRVCVWIPTKVWVVVMTMGVQLGSVKEV